MRTYVGPEYGCRDDNGKAGGDNAEDTFSNCVCSIWLDGKNVLLAETNKFYLPSSTCRVWAWGMCHKTLAVQVAAYQFKSNTPTNTTCILDDIMTNGQ